MKEQLIRANFRPRRKHIVLPSWVYECVDEETLMNEDGESLVSGAHLTIAAHKPR